MITTIFHPIIDINPADNCSHYNLKKNAPLTNFFKYTPTETLLINSDFFGFAALYSKAKGQYLRVALPMHALFQSNPLPETLPTQIPETVIKAAVSLVNLCIQHTSIIAGRDVKNGQIGNSPELQKSTVPLTHLQTEDEKLQQFVLMQPGAIISATRMTNISKFRHSGGKQRVIMVFTAIVDKNLATIQHKKNNVST